jgi:oxygen-independent coproporphyrinogen-3 oxidase
MPKFSPLPKLSIYLHWPYCQKICPFCDFNVYSARQNAIHEAEWLTHFRRELTHYHGLTAGRPLHSIYFGGGTPSLMSPWLVEQILNHISSLWPIAVGAEVTLEANPTGVEVERFAGFRAAGINRLSLGLQSITDQGLATLGRDYGRAQALQALAVAQRLFDRLSTDLIYGRAQQSLDGWQAELQEWQGFGVPHASLYQLTIESGTPFGQQVKRGALVMPDADSLADFYDHTNQLMRAAGYDHYEVSSYAITPAQRSQHNLNTWAAQDYIGIGPGAHGRLTLKAAHGRLSLGGGSQRIATLNHKKPADWHQAVAAVGHGAAEWEDLSQQTQAEEWVMLGLRQIGVGVDLAAFHQQLGFALIDWLGADEVAFWVEKQLLTQSPTHLAVPEPAINRLDALLARLLRATKR